ncbi:MAG: DUF5908 family protein [Microscillaceae bacterium]|nr:DUF5908 family protein [Microscillaceae bacterium]
MPVQINEITIKANVSDAQDGKSKVATPTSNTQTWNEQMLQALADKIMELIKAKQER